MIEPQFNIGDNVSFRYSHYILKGIISSVDNNINKYYPSYLININNKHEIRVLEPDIIK